MSKLVRYSLTEQAFEYIKEKILNGEWKTNEKIPSEIDLAQQLGVSRVSIRPAIQKANVLGLTETRAGEGTFVTDFSMRSYFKDLYDFKLIPNDYNQLNDFRMIMQIGSIRLALARKDDLTEEIAILEGIYAEMEDLLQNEDFYNYSDADYRFHEYICSMSHNPLIIMLYDAISHASREVSQSNIKFSYDINKGAAYIKSYHHAILTGIKKRDLNMCIKAEQEADKRSKQYYSNDGR